MFTNNNIYKCDICQDTIRDSELVQTVFNHYHYRCYEAVEAIIKNYMEENYEQN